MDAKTLALYEARAQVFKALGHPSRLLIVDELMQSERCVCDLTAIVGSDMSTVSKHLSVLKRLNHSPPSQAFTGTVQDRRAQGAPESSKGIHLESQEEGLRRHCGPDHRRRRSEEHTSEL